LSAAVPFLVVSPELFVAISVRINQHLESDEARLRGTHLGPRIVSHIIRLRSSSFLPPARGQLSAAVPLSRLPFSYPLPPARGQLSAAVPVTFALAASRAAACSRSLRRTVITALSLILCLPLVGSCPRRFRSFASLSLILCIPIVGSCPRRLRSPLHSRHLGLPQVVDQFVWTSINFCVRFSACHLGVMRLEIMLLWICFVGRGGWLKCS